MSEYVVTPEDIATWRSIFPELSTWRDSAVAQYAGLFKKEFIKKPYAIEVPKPVEFHDND